MPTLTALALVGAVASGCGGGERKRSSRRPTTTTTATEPGNGQAASGAQLFSDNCESCHGPDGAGGHVGPDLQKSPVAENLAQVENAGPQRRWGDAPVLRCPVGRGDRRGRSTTSSSRSRPRMRNSPPISLIRSKARFGVSFEDWIFALHLLIAATLVGSLVMSWIVVVALRSADTADATLSLNRVAMVGTGGIVVGLVGVISFRDLARDPARRLPGLGRLGDRGDRSLGHRHAGRCFAPSSSTRNPSRRRERSSPPARPARTPSSPR